MKMVSGGDELIWAAILLLLLNRDVIFAGTEGRSSPGSEKPGRVCNHFLHGRQSKRHWVVQVRRDLPQQHLFEHPLIRHLGRLCLSSPCELAFSFGQTSEFHVFIFFSRLWEQNGQNAALTWLTEVYGDHEIELSPESLHDSKSATKIDEIYQDRLLQATKD